MARPRKTEGRITHPLYSIAYLEHRRGRYYVVLKGKRTNTGLTWKPENKQLALKILEKVVHEYLNPKPQEKEQSVITVADALKKWVQIQRTRVEKDTIRKIRNAFNMLLPEIHFRLDDTDSIRVELLKNLANYEASPNTKHKYLAWIKQFFAFCVEEEYCERNPVKKAMFPRQTPVNREAFTQDEMTAIVVYFTNKSQTRDKKFFVLLLRFLAWTGVRISEALSIDWEDISETHIFIRHGKGGYQREIPIAPFPELRTVLDELAALQGSRTGLLFYWKAYAKLELWLRRGLEDLEIKGEGRNFHSIRKMFENMLLNEMKLPAHIAAQIMGHTVAIQQKHYLKALSVEELTKTIESFSGQNRDKITGKKQQKTNESKPKNPDKH